MDKLEQIEKLARAGLTQKEASAFMGVTLSAFHQRETWLAAFHKGLEARRKTMVGKVEHLAELGFSQ